MKSDATRKSAEIMALAAAIFSSQREAKDWLGRPAMGLAQRRPIDLMATTAGTEMVEDFLQRLAHGVYT